MQTSFFLCAVCVGVITWTAVADSADIRQGASHKLDIKWTKPAEKTDRPKLGKCAIQSPALWSTAPAVECVAAQFGAYLTEDGLEAAIVAAAAPTLCDQPSATDGAKYRGNIVIVRRGECSFATKVAFAEGAGAVGVLVANNEQEPPSAMGSLGVEKSTADAINIPALMVSRTVGDVLFEASTIDDGGPLVMSVIRAQNRATLSEQQRSFIDGNVTALLKVAETAALRREITFQSGTNNWPPVTTVGALNTFTRDCTFEQLRQLLALAARESESVLGAIDRVKDLALLGNAQLQRVAPQAAVMVEDGEYAQTRPATASGEAFF